MSKRFFEGAQHAARYALTRPTYPPELMKKIIDFLAMRVKLFGFGMNMKCLVLYSSTVVCTSIKVDMITQ